MKSLKDYVNTKGDWHTEIVKSVGEVRDLLQDEIDEL